MRIRLGQPEIDGHGCRPNLRNGVEGFELRARVSGDVRHAITGADTELLQCRRPAVTALKELTVGQPGISLHQGFAVSVELASPSCKVQRRQRCFHGVAG